MLRLFEPLCRYDLRSTKVLDRILLAHNGPVTSLDFRPSYADSHHTASSSTRGDDVPYDDDKSLAYETGARSSYFPPSALYASLFKFALPSSKQTSAAPSVRTAYTSQAASQSWRAL